MSLSQNTVTVGSPGRRLCPSLHQICDKPSLLSLSLSPARAALSTFLSSLTAISYSTLMNALCHSGECARALEVFREMIKRKLEPGLVSCNYVLTYCSKHKEGLVAMEFLMVMKKVSALYVHKHAPNPFHVFPGSSCVI